MSQKIIALLSKFRELTMRTQLRTNISYVRYAVHFTQSVLEERDKLI